MIIKPTWILGITLTVLCTSSIFAQVIRVPMTDPDRWQTISSGDSQVILNHDYSMDAIPAAPNGNDQIGVKLWANREMPLGSEEVAIIPQKVPRGFDYRLSVDLWGNYEWGSTQSRTEFLGTFIGHDGQSSGRNGAGFMYSNDGGAARDYRLYHGVHEQFSTSGQYASELFELCNPNLSGNNDCRDDAFDYWSDAFYGMDTGQALEPDSGQIGNPTDYQNFGVAGFQWVTIQTDVSYQSQTATVTMIAHGNPEFPNDPPIEVQIGTLDLSAYPDAIQGHAAVVYADLFANVSDSPAFSFGIADNFTLEFDGVGDFDSDGVYDCSDVDALVAEIAGGQDSPEFDLTADGLVNRDDLDVWLALGGAANLPSGNPYIRGDANLDGVVDVRDWNIWNRNKFQNIPQWCKADFTANGIVDISDFNIWNRNKFLSSDGANVVPEPSGWPLIVIGTLLAGLTYRRQLTRP